MQSLKLVKFLATWKWIQQLPTMLRPFVPSYSLQEFLSDATHLFRSPYVTIPNFGHFWLHSVTEYKPYPDLLCSALESLSNDDGEGNENVKKAVGLDLQNNNFAGALRFFVYSFAVTARPRRKKCLISRFLEDVNTRQGISFAFSELRYSLLGFNSRKNCRHLTS